MKLHVAVRYGLTTENSCNFRVRLLLMTTRSSTRQTIIDNRHSELHS